MIQHPRYSKLALLLIATSLLFISSTVAHAQVGMGQLHATGTPSSTTMLNGGNGNIGVWELVPVGAGGTGQAWGSAGADSIPYFPSIGVMGLIAPGTNGFLLEMVGGVPTWASVATGSGTVSTGTINQLAYYAAGGAVVSGETLFQAVNMPAFSGDVSNSSGSLATTVVAVQGQSWSTTAPTNNQVPTWNSSTSKWTPGTPSSSGVTSVTGTSPIVSSGGSTPAISINTASTSGLGAVQLESSSSDTSSSHAVTSNDTRLLTVDGTTITNNGSGVISAVPGAVNAKASCFVATTTALPSNIYVNGISGVGATLTAVSPGVLTIDGQATSVNQRLLIKNEATAANNGIYTVTTAGALGVAYILTRATDLNTSSEFPGASTLIETGTVNDDTGWICSNTTAPTVGTTAINFVQYAAPGTTYTGTAPIVVTGTVISANQTSTSQQGTLQLGGDLGGTATSQTVVSIASQALSSIVKGDVLVGTGSGTLARLAIGSTGQVPTVSGGTLVYATPSGGGISPTDYISGCYLQYDSTTAIFVNSGSAWVLAGGAGALQTVSSQQTVTPTLAASHLYYVYMTNGTTFVVNTTAPATNYQGTAWEDGSGNRYIGCFMTDASSHIILFQRSANYVSYLTNSATGVWAVLSGGAATSSTSVSCSGIVPKTSFAVNAQIERTGTGPAGSPGAAYIGDSIGGAVTSSNFAVGVNFAPGGSDITGYFTATIPLNTSQAFLYAVNGGSSTLSVIVLGYFEDR